VVWRSLREVEAWHMKDTPVAGALGRNFRSNYRRVEVWRPAVINRYRRLLSFCD
jgi:hypothetical protein